MPVCFVHLSDIHFGQEKGGAIVIHDDVKERLIHDAAAQVAAHAGGHATGIIVSGDIAYAGKSSEYKQAGAWLDRLTEATGCEKKTNAQFVPGNHDIDRDGITSGCKMMLDAIVGQGEKKLDEFLEAEVDRETLYNRFSAYRPFAEAYDLPGIASAWSQCRGSSPFVTFHPRTKSFVSQTGSGATTGLLGVGGTSAAMALSAAKSSAIMPLPT